MPSRFTYPLSKFLLASMFACATVAHADPGKIRVTILDNLTQRPVIDATVTLIPRSGPSQKATADQQGLVRISQLQPGLYTLVINHPLYQSLRLPRVRVVDNKTTSIEPRLAFVETSVAAMEEVLVLGNTIKRNPLNPAGTSVIDTEALNSAAGSGSDVLRSLDGLPGLFGDGEYSSFTVRGNGPRDNLILVDGVVFENLVHFNDSFGEQEEVDGGGRYSVFAPNTIASAEFQPGGWSPAYGGKAGSLLKLEVAEGNPETASYRARVDIAGLEIGYDGPSVFDNTSLLFSARHYNFENLFNALGMEDIGAPSLTDVIFKSATQASDIDKIKFLAIYAPEEYQRDIENVLASDDDEEAGDFGSVELVNSERDNSLLSLTWERLIGDDADLSNQIYFRDYQEHNIIGEAYPDLVPLETSAENVPQRSDILLSDREESELGLQTDFKVGNSLGRFSSGLRVTQIDLAFALQLNENWIRYTYDQNDYRANEEQRYRLLTPEAVNNRYADKATNYTVYLDQEFSFDSWSFRAGLRYDRDNFSDENLLSPRAGITWPVTDDLRLSATAGRYFQAPRFNDRAVDASNSQLENEIIDQLSVGINYRINDNLDFFIEPYYQKQRNLVVFEDGVNQTLSNNGQGKSFGVDTALSRQFDNGWSASINYSYNEAPIRDNADSAEYDADFNRPHILSIGGVWEINQRWKLSSRWKWASGKPKDVYQIHSNVLGAGQPFRYSRETIETNTERYGSYSSINFRADYLRTFGRTNVIAFIDVINLLGSDNPSNDEFNERRGRNEVDDGSPIPIIGLMFEW